MKSCPTCHLTYPDDFSVCPRDGAALTSPATETEAQLAAGLSRRFRIIRQLGKGGMGTVFLAEQIGVGNRLVALKVLNRKLLDDADFLVRFQNEAGSTGRIHHPNVVTIHESGQGDDGTPYIAMEFLEGESLREVMERRGALPVTEVAEILQQAARGLNAAHKLGIIHRDLKPDNIFLTYGYDESVAPGSPPAPTVGAPLVGALPVGTADTGRPQGPPLRPLVVKIVDFGIAKLRESATHTMTGTVLGTPAYMSYEQASGMRSDELDARSDIYSMGVVVYEMLMGRTPFHSDTPVGYLRKHLMEEPPPFRAVNPGPPVPPLIESVVLKALTKDRNQRYASVLEFAQEFVQVSTGSSELVARDATVKSQTQAEFSPDLNTAVPTVTPNGGPRSTLALVNSGDRHPKLRWLLGTLGFVILTFVAWFWFPRMSNVSKRTQNPVTESGVGQGAAAGQLPTAAGPLSPKPSSHPPVAIRNYEIPPEELKAIQKAVTTPGFPELPLQERVRRTWMSSKTFQEWTAKDQVEFVEALNERVKRRRECKAALATALDLQQKGDLDGAIEKFREAIRLSPDYAEAHYCLGVALEHEDQLQAALDEYQTADGLNSKDQRFRDNYDRLRKQLKP